MEFSTLLKATLSIFVPDDISEAWFGSSMMFFYKADQLSALKDSLPSRIASCLLLLTRGKKCSKPEDRIFALVGVFDHFGIPFPRPDYRKTLEDILTEATAAAIDFDQDIEIILHQAMENKQNNSLPSWVPDWSTFSYDSTRFDLERELAEPRFSLASASVLKYKISPDCKTLTLYGQSERIRDRAEAIPPTRDEYRDYLRAISAESSDFEFKHDRKKVIYLTQLRFMCIFLVWLDFADHNGIFKCHQSQARQERDAMLSCLTRESPRLGSIAGLKNTFCRWWELLLELTFADGVNQALWIEYNELPDDLIDTVMQETAGRQLFVTETGHFGTVETSVEPGDLVGQVMGMTEPIVVRKADEEYHLIGAAAYVNGTMQGETWPKDESLLIEIDLV